MYAVLSRNLFCRGLRTFCVEANYGQNVVHGEKMTYFMYAPTNHPSHNILYISYWNKCIFPSCQIHLYLTVDCANWSMNLFQLTNIFVDNKKYFCTWVWIVNLPSRDIAPTIISHNILYSYKTQKMNFSKLPYCMRLWIMRLPPRDGAPTILMYFSKLYMYLSNVFVNIAKCICTWVWIVHLPSRDIAPTIISHNRQPLMKFLSVLQDLFIS